MESSSCDPLVCKLPFGNIEIVFLFFFITVSGSLKRQAHTHTHKHTNTQQDILSANTVKHSNISILSPSITGRQQWWRTMTRMTASLITRNGNKHGYRLWGSQRTSTREPKAWRRDGRHYSDFAKGDEMFKKNKTKHTLGKTGYARNEMHHTREFVDTGIKRRDRRAGGRRWLHDASCPFWRRPDVKPSGVMNLSARTLSSVIRCEKRGNNSCPSAVSLASDCFYLSVTLTPFTPSSHWFSSLWMQLLPCWFCVFLQRRQKFPGGGWGGSWGVEGAGGVVLGNTLCLIGPVCNI